VQVLARKDALLANLVQTANLEDQIGDVINGAAGLKASMGRIKADLLTPYETMQTRTRQLGHIQTAADMLRRVHASLMCVF